MPNSLKCIKKFFKIDSSHNALLPNLGIVCYVGSQVLRFASAGSQILSLCPWGMVHII